MGVTKPRVSQIEAGEKAESLKLSTLRRAADALDCDLVYAFVPRGSYADVLDRQIDAKLSLVASQVSQTMLLENQLPDDESAARLREESAERLLAKGRLWNL